MEWENEGSRGRPKDAVERWKRDRDAQVNRQNIQESEQMITNEKQSMSSANRRMIILFNSSTLQRGCYFVEELFDLEQRINNEQSQRSTTEEKQAAEADSVN